MLPTVPETGASRERSSSKGSGKPTGKGSDEPTEVLPTVGEDAGDGPDDPGRAGEAPDSQAGTKRRAWRLSGRLRKFAEPPPVQGDTDHTIIPGLSDDD
ncbi:hypothetical protein [Actinoallomurus sp. NPDC052274]|uniref:hypothetical protein n=1 Tax=Actinoallomurus sp. NPDC052274 TaxID=3155420 RepID=UPI00341EBDE7